ncbi:MAG: hypothetical protein R3321_09105, partial [Nitrososphaeraceae archaeon]|nr:hypothetical protein [Nitrososphaeraceae archaeon]
MSIDFTFSYISSIQSAIKKMKFKYLFIIITLTILTIGCNSKQELLELKLNSASNYPRWLKTDDYRTNQTSGITFIGEDEGNKEFLLIDDIGMIHRLFISDDTVFTFEPITFSKKAENFFVGYPKLDFEDICYDRFSNSVFISIEGNETNFKDYTGILQMKFKDDNVHKNEIDRIVKLKITPEKQFLQYTEWNIGYEGLTVDSNYLYLGLEGFKNEFGFADSTIIFVVDKQN